jgi:hypothetical protein
MNEAMMPPAERAAYANGFREGAAYLEEAISLLDEAQRQLEISGTNTKDAIDLIIRIELFLFQKRSYLIDRRD